MPSFLLRSDKMLDLNMINKRHFDIKLNDLTLQVEPPTLKTLRKIAALTKSKTEEAVDDIAEAVRLILSKNSKGYQVSVEIIDELTLDQMLMIIKEFFKWMREARNNDPN